MVSAQLGRSVCYRCHKAQLQCVCQGLEPVHNRTRITVLQHPRERHHPLGTARLLRLGLDNVHLQVCYDLLADSHLQAQTLGQASGILYPHARAKPLRGNEAEPPDNLIVLDGTWSQARVLYRHNPWMHALPHYSITPDGIDRYRIRREPAAHCASTLEAVVFALQALEPDTPGLTHLLAHFSSMIDRQVACIGKLPQQQRFRVRPKPVKPTLPPEFTTTVARQVVVYCEFRLRRDLTPPQRELSFVAAHHLQSERTMAWAAAEAQDNLHHLAHMALTRADLTTCQDLAEFDAQWRAFCPADPVVLAWNQASLDLARQVIGPNVPAFLLKALYCNLHHMPSGHLEDVLVKHGLRPTPLPCPGRPQKRLGSAAAMAHWLHGLGASGADFETTQQFCQAGQIESFDAQAAGPHQHRMAVTCVPQR